MIFVGRELIRAALFGPQHRSLATTWYWHCTICLGNIPDVDTRDLFHMYNSRSGVLTRHILRSASEISFSFVLTRLGSADTASPDSHWTRAPGSLQE